MTETERSEIAAALLPFVTMWKAVKLNEDGMICSAAPYFQTEGIEKAGLMPSDFERAEAALKMVTSIAAGDVPAIA